jgi:hypothetical protein
VMNDKLRDNADAQPALIEQPAKYA